MMANLRMPGMMQMSGSGMMMNQQQQVMAVFYHVTVGIEKQNMFYFNCSPQMQMSSMQMHNQQMQMMQRMRMQQMQQMPGRPDGMMPNGSSMEMNGMMMRGPGPGGMQGMQRGQPGMGPMMMPGMRHMMGPGHPGMHQGMGNRPPPPEYSMSSQVPSTPKIFTQKINCLFLRANPCLI